jgi:hypothetical protein
MLASKPSFPALCRAYLEAPDFGCADGRILLTSGRQLARTSTSAPPPASGPPNVTTILAHLHAGILRCLALAHVLVPRAAAGRDIPFATRHT